MFHTSHVFNAHPRLYRLVPTNTTAYHSPTVIPRLCRLLVPSEDAQTELRINYMISIFVNLFMFVSVFWIAAASLKQLYSIYSGRPVDAVFHDKLSTTMVKILMFSCRDHSLTSLGVCCICAIITGPQKTAPSNGSFLYK